MVFLGLWLNALYFMLRVQGTGGAFPPPLSAEDEQICVQQLAAGDPAARNKLIEHNLRLVAHIVKKYYAEPADQDDLISIGTIGLIKAVDTYRPDRSVRLATYAARCIENEILMHFRAGRKNQNDVSLSESPDSDGDNSLSLLEMISVEDDRLNLVELSDRYQKMYEFLNTRLEPRERDIIRLRYGLEHRNPMTQREIASAYGISRSYVSRIEKRALTKLADAMKESGFAL